MEENRNVNVQRSLNRTKRVKRIKRIILLLILLMLVLPIVFCIYLIKKVDHLEDRIEEIKIMRQQYTPGSNEVLAAEIKNPDGMNMEGEPEEAAPVPEEENREAISKNVNNLQSDKNVKKVYLTFDDGPSILTPRVLDILKKEEVKATFFVNGKENDMAKELYRRIADEGHTLGMHSYSHQYDSIYKSLKNFKKDFNKLSDLLYETTGVRSKYFRFPGGSGTTRNKVPIKDLIRFLKKEEIFYYDWNVTNGDAEIKTISDKQMIKRVMDNVDRFNTPIVLMHDAMDKEATVRTLPKIIKRLKKEGYAILPINEDTYPIRQVK